MADDRLECADIGISTEKASETALVEKAKKGDKEAFSQLVRLNQDKIFNAAYRLCNDFDDASEISQRVFINAYRKITEFRNECAFSTWLYRIAFNQNISLKRQKSAHKNLPFLTDEEGKVIAEPPDCNFNPVKVAQAKEEREIIQSAICELGEMDRKVVVLKDVENLSYGEIADVLDVDISTVRSRLHRARLRLKEKLVDRVL